MIDAKITKLERRLRKRVELLLNGRAKQRKTLVETIRHLKSCELPAFIFGGTLRDLMVYRMPFIPRDLDIVAETVDNPRFESLLRKHVCIKNRFGGYHLNVQGWQFDLWGLADTWAFKERLVSDISFERLPKTSFLNIEAIVVRIDTEPFKVRELFSHGFFEAFLQRTLEINLEDNPFPSACVLRSLIWASRLRFAIGPRLANYLVHYGTAVDTDELGNLRWRHYKRTTYSPSDFKNWLDSISEQLRVSRNSPVHLPAIALKWN